MSFPPHPALCTDEIIRSIIALLDRKAVVRLARTCKAFQEAALDALWREIPSVEPLFALFPPNSMLGNRSYEAVVRRTFSRYLIPSDWTRFRYYAPRIMSMRSTEARWSRWAADESAYMTLSHFSREPLLPNLRHWSWDAPRGNGDIVGAMVFLHDTVTSIEVTLGHNTTFDSVFAFLCNLPERVPFLEDLAIHYNDREWPEWRLEVTMSTLSEVFHTLPRLRKLSLPFFMDTPAFIYHMGCIPTLRELTISCADKLVGHFVDDDAEEIPSIEDVPLFLSVKRVDLQSTMSSCLRFLNRISSHQLEALHLTVLHLRSPVQLSHCVETVAQNAHSIRSFHLHYTPAPHDLHFDNTWFTIEPLTECNHLEELSITHPRPIPFTDEEIMRAAKAWPKLRKLRLNPRPTRSVIEPRVTLQAVVYIARYCTRLHTLRLYVDTREIPIPMHSSNVIRLLDFGISARSDTQQLATFIANVCPEASVTGTESWKEVDVILSVNKATRSEDKKRIDALQAEVERLKAMLGGATLK